MLGRNASRPLHRSAYRYAAPPLPQAPSFLYNPRTTPAGKQCLLSIAPLWVLMYEPPLQHAVTPSKQAVCTISFAAHQFLVVPGAYHDPPFPGCLNGTNVFLCSTPRDPPKKVPSKSVTMSLICPFISVPIFPAPWQSHAPLQRSCVVFCGLLHRFLGIAHGHADTSCLYHLYIVDVIPNGQHLIHRNAEFSARYCTPRTLLACLWLMSQCPSKLSGYLAHPAYRYMPGSPAAWVFFHSPFQADQFADILALFYHFLQAIADGESASTARLGGVWFCLSESSSHQGSSSFNGVHHIAAIGIELVFPA